MRAVLFCSAGKLCPVASSAQHKQPQSPGYCSSMCTEDNRWPHKQNQHEFVLKYTFQKQGRMDGWPHVHSSVVAEEVQLTRQRAYRYAADKQHAQFAAYATIASCVQ